MSENSKTQPAEQAAIQQSVSQNHASNEKIRQGKFSRTTLH